MLKNNSLILYIMAENITYDWYYDSREKNISSFIKKL